MERGVGRTEQIHIDHENALSELHKCEYTAELLYITIQYNAISDILLSYTFQEYKTDLLGTMNHGSHKICLIFRCHFLLDKKLFPFYGP